MLAHEKTMVGEETPVPSTITTTAATSRIGTVVAAAVAPAAPDVAAPALTSPPHPTNRRCWIPLAYPVGALKSARAHFPLHPAVLTATVRELLILDQSVDARTLKLNMVPRITLAIPADTKAKQKDADEDVDVDVDVDMDVDMDVDVDDADAPVVAKTHSGMAIPTETAAPLSLDTSRPKRLPAFVRHLEPQNTYRDLRIRGTKVETSRGKNKRKSKTSAIEANDNAYAKRTLPPIIRVAKKRKRHNVGKNDLSSPSSHEGASSSAESVAKTIVERSLESRRLHEYPRGDGDGISTDQQQQQVPYLSIATEWTGATETSRPPRKVSDVVEPTLLFAKQQQQHQLHLQQQEYRQHYLGSQHNNFLWNDQTVGFCDLGRFLDLEAMATKASCSNITNNSKNSSTGLVWKADLQLEELPNFLEASIATEELLQRTACSMVRSLVQTFTDTSLRLFFGYKTPLSSTSGSSNTNSTSNSNNNSNTIGRDLLEEVLASYLFDTSHAMFAWEQTEREFATMQPPSLSYSSSRDNCNRIHTTADTSLTNISNGANTDTAKAKATAATQDRFSCMPRIMTTVRKEEAERDKQIAEILFDERARRKIGGTGTSSILAHAISIQRHEQQKQNQSHDSLAMVGNDNADTKNDNGSWESFALTKQGKSLLEHHSCLTKVVIAGQCRRGQRLRKRRLHRDTAINRIRNASSSSSSVAGTGTETSGSMVSGNDSGPQGRRRSLSTDSSSLESLPSTTTTTPPPPTTTTRAATTAASAMAFAPTTVSTLSALSSVSSGLPETSTNPNICSSNSNSSSGIHSRIESSVVGGSSGGSMLTQVVPMASQVRLKRPPGTSWGVLLSKEGNMCIVERGNTQTRTAAAASSDNKICPEPSCHKGADDDEDDDDKRTKLRKGDLIVQVGCNETGQSIVVPSFAQATSQKQGWFQDIVSLFKQNNELSLIVQRVNQ